MVKSSFSTVHVACIQGVFFFFGLLCCCIFLGWVARPCIGLCSNAFPGEWLRNSSFPALSCENFPYRFACVLVCVCAFDIARQRGSAPRSFRSCACARNFSNFSFFCVFVILQIFHSVGPFGVFSMLMTLVYCGSLASVHSHKPGSPSRVSASCPTLLHCFFSGSSPQAPSCERVANSLSVLAGAITSLSIGVAGNSLIGLLIGFALQPLQVPSFPVPVIPTRENTPRPEHGVCGEVRDLAVGFAIGMCTCVTLC